MKYFQILILIIIIYNNTLAQDTTFYNAFDEKVTNKKRAYYSQSISYPDSIKTVLMENYMSGIVKSKTVIRKLASGHEIRNTTQYFENGKPELSYTELDGLLAGTKTYYWDNGKPSIVITYQKGQATTIYYDENGIQKTTLLAEAAKDSNHEVVEQMPEYPGGTGAMMKYIAKNLIYPRESVAKDHQGRVIVTFIINEEGKACYIRVLNGIDIYLDREAIRVISSMPLWKPAMHNGEPVSVQFTIPLKFNLVDLINK